MMKLLITALIFTLSTYIYSQTGSTVSATLEWDPNPASENVTGYRIHWGTNPKVYTQSMNVTETTGKVSGLSKNVTYYFAVTAVRGSQESLFSDEVSSLYTEPEPQPPKPPYSISSNGGVKVNPDGSVDLTVEGIEGGYCEVETSYDF
jgi:hypothetical protein